MIDWTKPIQTAGGLDATAVFRCTVELRGEAGRWPYNPDGTPMQGYPWLPVVRNVLLPANAKLCGNHGAHSQGKR